MTPEPACVQAIQQMESQSPLPLLFMRSVVSAAEQLTLPHMSCYGPLPLPLDHGLKGSAHDAQICG
jgi:hypothetical protein